MGFVLIGASVLVSVLSYLQLSAPVESDAVPMLARSTPATKDLVSIVTARQPIQRGQRISASLLSKVRIEPPLPLGVMRESAAVTGAVALNDISQGQIITEGSLLIGEDARPGLSVLVPDGLRAVALRVNDETSVGNFVRPNDRVDIHLVLPSDRVARVVGKDIRRGDHTDSSVLLQNVLILSTGDTLASPDGQNATPMKNITVAVSPDDAVLLGIAMDAGKYYLALRNPTDKAITYASRKHVKDLLAEVPRRALPPPPQKRTPVASKPRPRRHTVTVTRGKNSETITFTPDGES